MTHQPRVVLCSMWRDDCARRLVDRVEHLLAKSESYPALRWVWVVGDSRDDTENALRDLSVGYDVTVIHHDTGIVGDESVSRLRRLSQTGNVYWRQVQLSDDFVLVHESDIASPSNIVNRMVARAEQYICPIAAWPMLEISPGIWVLYDVWALRANGQRFRHTAPYHAVYRSDAPFMVDSFGTCFMLYAEDAGYLHMDSMAVLDICKQLRLRGHNLWVDPTLEVVQPYDLWVPYNTREYA